MRGGNPGVRVDKVQQLASWLATQPEMEFSVFVVSARQAGLDPAVWLKAKQGGQLIAEIRDGVHYIRAANAPAAESAVKRG